MDISRHLTLEDTARAFSEKWNKDVNRTHIARIKQNFKSTLGQLIQEDLVALQEDQREFELERAQMKRVGAGELFHSAYLNLNGAPTRRRHTPTPPPLIDGGMISDASDDYKHSVSSSASVSSVIQKNDSMSHRGSVSSESARSPEQFAHAAAHAHSTMAEPTSVIQQNLQAFTFRNETRPRPGSVTPPLVYRCPQCPKFYESAHDFWLHLRIEHLNTLYNQLTKVPAIVHTQKIVQSQTNTAEPDRTPFRHGVISTVHIKRHVH